MQLLGVTGFLNSIAISAESDELVFKTGSSSSLGHDFTKTVANESFAEVTNLVS
jgi:hypothetical protein